MHQSRRPSCIGSFHQRRGVCTSWRLAQTGMTPSTTASLAVQANDSRTTLRILVFLKSIKRYLTSGAAPTRGNTVATSSAVAFGVCMTRPPNWRLTTVAPSTEMANSCSTRVMMLSSRLASARLSRLARGQRGSRTCHEGAETLP